MTNYNQNSQRKTIFHGFPILEDGATLAGYAALIEAHNLKIPTPDTLCAIGTKHKISSWPPSFRAKKRGRCE